MNAKDDGEISELGLKRIRYCEAAPKTSNMVDSGDETRADERPPVFAPATTEAGCAGDRICALEPLASEVDEPEAARLDDDGDATG